MTVHEWDPFDDLDNYSSSHSAAIRDRLIPTIQARLEVPTYASSAALPAAGDFVGQLARTLDYSVFWRWAGTRWAPMDATFATAADRAAAIVTPAANDRCTVGSGTTWTEYVHDGSGWVADVEVGSNSAGAWRKYRDGLLICQLDISVSDQAINSAYGSVYLGSRAWTFPVAFAAAPTVSCSTFKWGTGAGWAAADAISSTGCTLRGFDAVSRASGTTVKISASAIGRWK